MKKIAFIGVGGYFGGKMTRLLEEKRIFKFILLQEVRT